MIDLAPYQDPPTMQRVLREARTIAVVGLSTKPHRPSHGVAAYLQRHGYRIIPVNPHETEVLGEKAYSSLRDVRCDGRCTSPSTSRRETRLPGAR